MVKVSSVEIIGNKITRDKIILREMMILPGDSVQESDVEELLKKSRQNLLNTSLFNFVDIVQEEESSGDVKIIISVIERWYIWPTPIVKLGDRNFNVWWKTRDFGRLSYGFYVDWRNFRGRRENLITRFQVGYDQLFDLQYSVPYLNRKKTLGGGFGSGFQGNHEVAYITKNNKQEFYRSRHGYAGQDFFAYVQLQFRKNIYNTHLFELRFDHQIFDDSLLLKNPSFSTGGQTNLDYLTLHYKYKSDHRDFSPYPLMGYYFDFEAYKYGLGFEDKNAPDIFNLYTTFRKYWKFSKRIYYAAGLNCKFSSDKQQPYFLMKAVGYGRDVVRSYEYYVIDGNSFGILKTNLKFALVNQRDGEFKFIRSEKFSKFYYALYTNLFLDMGYAYNPNKVSDLNNYLQNEFLLGFGLGIDFVTYYDIVMRFEYSVNRMWEQGFFISFNAPI